MDKEKCNTRTYTTYLVSITVSNGEVEKCCFKNEVVTKGMVNFKEVLEKAMKELAIRKPRAFKQMYKSLYMSTREYKLAKKLYEKYDIKRYVY